VGNHRRHHEGRQGREVREHDRRFAERALTRAWTRTWVRPTPRPWETAYHWLQPGGLMETLQPLRG
jgi:hypothetical protein